MAGPVVAAAAHIPGPTYEHRAFRRDSRAINDSKQLKPEQRDEQYALIERWRKDGVLVAAAGSATVAEIEELNILGATRLAMQRAITELKLELLRSDAVLEDELFEPAANPADYPRMLVDGRPLKPFTWRHNAIVGGDGKSLAIAMASVIAKVTRDRMMVELHAEDSRYGYDQHKGYGAPRHIEALREHGQSSHHRVLFLRKFELSLTEVQAGESI